MTPTCFAGPHQTCKDTECSPATTTIPLESIIQEPKVVQQGTHLRTVSVKIGSIPVPIYVFKQPRRLSELELPFKIVLLRGAPPGHMRIIQTDSQSRATDSWFPGYRWDCIVCTSCSKITHMGWQFSSGDDIFHALIVDYVESERSADGEAVLDLSSVTVGIKAGPAILAMLAIETASAKRS